MNLVVQDYHEKIGHSCPEATLGTTRQKYWIVSGINTVKHYLKTCVTCIKKHARMTPQLLGDHPPARVTVWEPAFTHTGIDYYGPFLVTTGIHGKTCKFWGVIFTCRAVHLDIVDSRYMDGCLNVIDALWPNTRTLPLPFTQITALTFAVPIMLLKECTLKTSTKNTKDITVLKRYPGILILR